MKTKHFIKMHGLGNDFVIFDQRVDSQEFSKEDIINISDRNKGIGCDQVITINNMAGTKTELIEFYNSNGEEVYACGNGSRCVANLLMKEKNINEIKIHTKEKKLICSRVSDDIISIDMGKPQLDWKDIPLIEDPKNKKIQFKIDDIILENPKFINVGNPHIIFFVDKIDNFDIHKFGPLIENNKLFPEKINVSIAEIVSSSKILLNVWERGAGKTLACGTAACAASVVAIMFHKCDNELSVSLPGGDLNIFYEINKNIIMSGKTELSYEGNFEL